jgi:hypothetical protein
VQLHCSAGTFQKYEAFECFLSHSIDAVLFNDVGEVAATTTATTTTESFALQIQRHVSGTTARATTTATTATFQRVLAAQVF